MKKSKSDKSGVDESSPYLYMEGAKSYINSVGPDTVRRLVRTAHENGVPVIVSNHDFKKTPPKEELLDRLENMQELGADILKIAVMPESTEDLLTLLAATEDGGRYLKQPIVSMSMGGKGILSRVAGESFGSAITFGTAGAASAPGQLPAEELKEILEGLHKESSSLH